jgi:hypothetical protein
MSSPFCSEYFRDSVLLFAQAPLDHSPPILSFQWSLEWQACTTTPSIFPLRQGLLMFFAQAGLESQCFWSQPPKSKNYRYEPLAPSSTLIFFVCEVLGLELMAFTLNHSTSPIFVKGVSQFGLASNHSPPDLCLLRS